MTTPFLFSNSSTHDWHTCKRKFWWRYLYAHHGITRIGVEEDLLFGAVVHDALVPVWEEAYTSAHLQADRQRMEQQFLADPNWLPQFTPDAREAKASEWGRLFEGQITIFQRTMLPMLKQQYRMESAEGDVVRWLPEYGQMKAALIAKPDTLLVQREDVQDDGNFPLPTDGLGYLEFKTVANPGDRWAATFIRNPQSWTGAMTVRAAKGVDIQWFLALGLIKGSEVSDDFMGKRRASPLCWAYRLLPGAGSGRPSKVDEQAIEASDGSKWSAEGTTAKGWERTSTDLFPGGVSAWAMELPDAIAVAQMCMTPPVTIDWELAEEWLENQRPMIEASVQWKELLAQSITLDKLLALRNTLFPRELSQCESWRGPCGFVKACHNQVVGDAPLLSGYFQHRRQHHPIEQLLCGTEQLKEQ